MLTRRAFKAMDKTFLLTLACLIAFGLMVLASASHAAISDSFFYMERQLMWIVLGIGMVILMMNIDFTQSARYSKLLYVITIVILLAVLVLGKTIRGATGWIVVGGQQFQPAEIAKILMILCFADFLNKRKGMLNTFSSMIPCFAYIGFPFLLVLAQPDLGTGLAFIFIMLGMMFVAGANPRILLFLIILGVVSVVAAVYLHNHFGLWLPLKDYQLKRLTVFTNPYNDGMGGRGPGWNTIQALVAVGSGGFFGKGLFHGTQVQLNFLPEQHTDFIFAVVGEELGFLGSGVLLLLFAILILRAIYIAFNAKDFYSTLVAIGIVSMWIYHVYQNIGMSIGIMPITGIPLPFISYGGSFMIANMTAVGMLLDINVKGRKIVF